MSPTSTPDCSTPLFLVVFCRFAGYDYAFPSYIWVRGDLFAVQKLWFLIFFMDFHLKAILESARIKLWDFDIVVECSGLKVLWVSEKLSAELDLKADDIVGRYAGEIVLLDEKNLKDVFLRVIRRETSLPLVFVSRLSEIVNLMLKVETFEVGGSDYLVGKLI